MYTRLSRYLLVGVIAAASLACTKTGAPAEPLARPASAPEHVDLDALLMQAAQEPPLVVYNNSGVVTDEAASFAARYGVKATGIKANTPEMIEKVSREVEAGNVTPSILQIEDGPGIAGLLQPQGYVVNWLPDTLAPSIRPEWQDPLVLVWHSLLFSYNTEVYPNGCPIKNIWELTDPRWRGKVAYQDPLSKPTFISWFAQLTMNNADELAAAYQAYAGQPLQTQEQNASWEFVKRLAANRPILFASDEDASADANRIGRFAASRFTNQI